MRLLLILTVLVVTSAYCQLYDNLVIAPDPASPTPVMDTLGNIHFPGSVIPNGRVIVFDALVDTVSFIAQVREISTGEIRNVPVSWRLTNGTAFSETSFPVHAILRLNASKGVTLDTVIATYGSEPNLLSDTVVITVKPPFVSRVVLLKSDTFLTAGDTFHFNLEFFDSRGDTVFDPTRLPDSISIYAAENELLLSTGSLLTISRENIPYSKVSLASLGIIPTKVSGSNKLVVLTQFRRSKMDFVSWGDTAWLTVKAGRADSMVVYKSGTTIRPSLDKITSFGSDLSSGRVSYEVSLFDRFGNRLDTNSSDYTSPSVERVITGSAIDTNGFMSIRHRHIYTRTGNESGGISKISFVFTPLIGAQVIQRCSIQVIPIVGVKKMSTHEWVADPVSNRGEVEYVLQTVLGLPVDAVANNPTSDSVRYIRYLQTLQDYGFNSKRDGFLDFINIELSSPFLLNDSMVTAIFFTKSTDTLFWAIHDSGYSVGNL